MSDLRQRLARLGLSQYLEVFTSEGFDTWDTVLDITESDLSHLQVKLGHRRKLQRAIAESRGQSSDRPLPLTLPRAASVEGSYRSGDESGTETKGKQGESSTPGTIGQSTKRKYRRHPKPDEHAPERPPSAYVIFSNQVRELLKGQDLSFTEIAKVVGERWQVLPSPEREACERQANTAKERYYAELADYKKTPQYDAYQKYLEDFKAKHAAPTKGKRSRLETEPSASTRSNSHDQLERSASRRFSGHVDSTPSSYHRSDNSPPLGSGRPLTGMGLPPKPTSPTPTSISGLNSPRASGYYSPIAASPRSATIPKEPLFDPSIIGLARDPRLQHDSSTGFHAPAYPPTPQQSSSSGASSVHPLSSHYQTPIDLPSRRSVRDTSSLLPPLTREDTTWSSESGQSGHNVPATNYLPTTLPLDPAKTSRLLPQPIPSIGPSTSPLDRPAPPAMSQIHPQDYRTQGPLAALVRAGELAARVVDDELLPDEVSP